MRAKKILRKYFHGLTDEQFGKDVSEYPLNNVISAMEECINNDWISVRDKLPKEGEAVLTTIHYEDSFMGNDSMVCRSILTKVRTADRARSVYVWVNEYFGLELEEVTHWMPIPEPAIT